MSSDTTPTHAHADPSGGRAPSVADGTSPSRDGVSPPKGRSLVEPRVSDDPAGAGPTSPGRVTPSRDAGPETGGYDDHSPSRHPTNEKGGYGAG